MWEASRACSFGESVCSLTVCTSSTMTFIVCIVHAIIGTAGTEHPHQYSFRDNDARVPGGNSVKQENGKPFLSVSC